MDFIDKFSENARESVEKKKESQRRKRCEKCWLDINELCICERIPQLQFPGIHFVIYQHYQEFFNPGDDAKLLRITSPSQTTLVLYPIENQKLVDICTGCSKGSLIVLFPDKDAILIDSFLAVYSQNIFTEKEKAFAESTSIPDSENTLTVIVVDAVWRHARKMAKRLSSLLPHAMHVQLEPESLSVYARTQTQSDRVSSVEAVALLLSQLGHDADTCSKLVECVKINNSALKRKKKPSIIGI